MDNTVNFEEIRVLVEELSRPRITKGWVHGIKFDDNPLQLDVEAVELWQEAIEDFSRRIIKTACGLGIMKSHCIVTKVELEQAIDIYRKGLNNFLSSAKE